MKNHFVQYSHSYDEFRQGQKFNKQELDKMIINLLDKAKEHIRLIKWCNPETAHYEYRIDLLLGKLEVPDYVEIFQESDL